MVNHWERLDQIPAETELSKAVSKALKKEGFKFCGPTIVYAFMQAVGMINDHFAALALEHADKVLARSHKITRGNLSILEAWIANELKTSATLFILHIFLGYISL